MELSYIITISCVMTAISMGIFVFVIFMTARFGGQWVKVLIDRFTGGGDDKDKQQDTSRTGATPQPQIASSQSLRRRARELDFPAPGQTAGASATAFSAQSDSGNTQYPDFPAPNFQPGQQQQASLRPRGQYPDFNPQAQQGSTQSFSTPSLSPSRPFQAGSQFNANQPQRPNQPGQQQGFNAQGYGQQGQQPLNPLGQTPQNQNQFGQQPQQNYGQQPQQQFGQQGRNPLGQTPQQQNYRQQPQQNQYGQQGQNPLGQTPQQQGFNSQGYNQQNPNQRGQQNQYGQQPQQNYGQQPQQQSGLGQNRPPLRSVPRPGNTQYDRPIGGRDRRQSDDRDVIYDDRSGGNFMDDIGDFIDKV